jgi:lantibiotic modifying enzyme
MQTTVMMSKSPAVDGKRDEHSKNQDDDELSYCPKNIQDIIDVQSIHRSFEENQTSCSGDTSILDILNP